MEIVQLPAGDRRLLLTHYSQYYYYYFSEAEQELLGILHGKVGRVGEGGKGLHRLLFAWPKTNHNNWADRSLTGSVTF